MGKNYNEDREQNKKQDRLYVGSVEKAFMVLEAFKSDLSDLSLNEIISRTGLNKSAAQRFTHTLQCLGYLNKDSSSRRYSISKKVLKSANSFLSVDALVNRAMPNVIEIRRKLNMRIGVGCLNDINAMYLIPLQSNRAAFRTAHPGFEVPLFCTSTGRTLLAYLNKDEAKKILENSDRKQYTPFTITDIDKLMMEIDLVHQNGYCITEQELVMADINIAVPIFNSRGQAIATVTASGSNSHWSKKDLVTKVASLMIETASAISITA